MTTIMKTIPRMMRVRRLRLLLCALALLCALPAAGGEVWRGSYPLAPHGVVSVENVNGAIRIEGWDRAEVEIEVWVSSRAGLAARDTVRVGVSSGENRIAFRTEYLALTGDEVRTDYFLRIPRQAAVEFAGTLAGDIEVVRLEGAVSVHALNGDVTGVDLAGEAVLRAGNGNVVASFRQLPERGGHLRLESINGDLTLVLPDDADAELAMDTVAGAVKTPFAARASVSLEETGVRARVGRGGVLIRLTTVRGDIRVVTDGGSL